MDEPSSSTREYGRILSRAPGRRRRVNHDGVSNIGGVEHGQDEECVLEDGSFRTASDDLTPQTESLFNSGSAPSSTGTSSSSLQTNYQETIPDDISQISQTTYSEGPYSDPEHTHTNPPPLPHHNPNNINNAYYNNYFGDASSTYTYTPITPTSLEANNVYHSHEPTSARYREEVSRGLRHTAQQDFRVPYASIMSEAVGDRHDGIVPMERYWQAGANNLQGKVPLPQRFPASNTNGRKKK